MSAGRGRCLGHVLLFDQHGVVGPDAFLAPDTVGRERVRGVDDERFASGLPHERGCNDFADLDPRGRTAAAGHDVQHLDRPVGERAVDVPVAAERERLERAVDPMLEIDAIFGTPHPQGQPLPATSMNCRSSPASFENTVSRSMVGRLTCQSSDS